MVAAPAQEGSISLLKKPLVLIRPRTEQKFIGSFFQKRTASFLTTGQDRSFRPGNAAPTPPLRRIGQREQVETAEQKQEEWGERRVGHPKGRLTAHSDSEISDDRQRKGNGKPTVNLSCPRAPTHWVLAMTAPGQHITVRLYVVKGGLRMVACVCRVHLQSGRFAGRGSNDDQRSHCRESAS